MLGMNTHNHTHLHTGTHAHTHTSTHLRTLSYYVVNALPGALRRQGSDRTQAGTLGFVGQQGHPSEFVMLHSILSPDWTKLCPSTGTLTYPSLCS